MTDKSAIEAIQANSAYDVTKLVNAGIPAIVIPSHANLQSIEHLNHVPCAFKNIFNTHIPSEFTNYFKDNSGQDSTVYINSDQMEALAILDHGNINEPHWGHHQAKIGLRKKPSYSDLVNKNDKHFRQTDLIDFLVDWKEKITFFDAEIQPIVFQTAINRIRKISLHQLKNVDSEVADYSAKKSTMESVEIKSGNEEIPAGFFFKSKPYDEFDEQQFYCKLRAATTGDEVLIRYRIEGLSEIEEGIANEFRELIKSDLHTETKIYIGQANFR